MFDLWVALLGCIAELVLAAVLVCVACARSLSGVLNVVNLRFLAHRVYVALVAAVASVPGCIAIRRCRRDRRFPLVPKCSSGRSRCLVPRPPAVPSFRRCERRPRMASHRLLLVQPARDRRAVRSGPRSSVSSVRSRRRPAGLAFLVNVACLALLVYIAYVESIAWAASRPGQRPGLGGPSCGGEGAQYARGSPCVRSSWLRFPGGRATAAPPGCVESRSPGLPRVPRERRVPRAARLRRVRRENTAQVASCPASGLGWADYRAGERRPYAQGAPRAHGLPGSVSPGVKLPPALRGRSRAACSWTSRPGIPALPAGCAPEGSRPGRGSAAVVAGPWLRIPMAEDRPAGFRRCPACPAVGVEVEFSRRLASRPPGRRSCTAR